jgi:hypothetical protein
MCVTFLEYEGYDPERSVKVNPERKTNGSAKYMCYLPQKFLLLMFFVCIQSDIHC